MNINLYFLKKNIIIILIILNYNCSNYYISNSLLPSKIEKTINRFNYCLNLIHESHIFKTITQILVGEIKKEFLELKNLIKIIKITKSSLNDNLRENLKTYISFAKKLKIKIIKINYKKNKAKVLVLYHNAKLIMEEQRIMHLIKIKNIWKIKKIIIS